MRTTINDHLHDDHAGAAPASGHVGRSDPSSAKKRFVVAALALVGALVSARLAGYQLGLTAPPWEPLFGDGTERVLRSSFSRALPVPDALLGVGAYLAEVAAVAWGGTRRWQTRRVAVYVYAAIALGMALGSAGLVALQLTLHVFCTLCLLSALLSFALAVPAAEELAAAWKWKPRRRS